MRFLDIGEVAERAGVRASALRYYDEIGLISAVARHGLRRQFGPEVLVQLKLVAMGQAAGFSLAEIAKMFSPEGAPDLPRELLRGKADQIDARIGELMALSDTLRHMADCPAPSHMECPRFRRILDQPAAGKRARRRQRVTRA